MILDVQELNQTNDNTVVQEIKITRTAEIIAVCPHIYRHKFPSGSLKIVITDEKNKIIRESNSINISGIGSLNYAHGYVRFDLAVSLQKDQVYRIHLIADNYSFTEGNYVGICSDYDLQKYERNYIPTQADTFPFDIELWEKKRL